MKRKASKKSAKPAAKRPAKATAKRSAKVPAARSKAAGTPATTRTTPGPRAAAAPALKAQATVEAAKYTPAEITGVGWKPFRYPPD
jgi:hypothetical protein